MRHVLRAKFTQHDDLRQLLLSTGDARIVEAGRVANVVNCTWGEVNGKGRNMLGVLLMELRTELIKASSAAGPKTKSTFPRNGLAARGSKISATTLRRGAAATTA
jgi:hypothetical protein